MQEFDYVIAGAGSAGCVVARRLVDAGHTVCLIEAGKRDKSALIHVPLGTALMLPTKLFNWAYETVPQAGLKGRAGYQPRGKMLGGSSGMNAMIYIRGHRSDYDDWAALGNAGWDWDSVLPYFKRAENNERGADDWHGTGGPLNVADHGAPNPFNEHFLGDAQEMQHRYNPDFNGESQEGVGPYQVTQKDGRRWSTAQGYIRPVEESDKLRIVSEAHVTGLTFDGKRCTGVSFRQKGHTDHVKARSEVILSAGAFGTPQTLMLSGIGEAEALRAQGIEVLHDLPGVGQNLQDHPDYVTAFKSKSLDLLGISLPGLWRMTKEFFRYRKSGVGMFASNAAEMGGFLKTAPSLDRPDIQLHFVNGLIDDHNRKMHFGHGFSCHVCVLRPKSTGTVTLRDRDPLSAPLIDPGFFRDEADLEVMVKGFKIMRQILRGPRLSKMATSELYTADVETDEQIRDAIRSRADTIYHPVGTAKMGTDAMAVVAPDSLKVHGLEGLRVVDASIMPTLIGGNTNAPTIMIAEKASDMILGAE